MSSIFVGNSSSNRTITWQPEPLARGTWSILSVCIITTALCVWTALHLNIPPRDQKHPQFWRKLYWLGIGLFAPEVVAYTAWNQRQAASKGLKGIRNAIGQKPSVSWAKKAFLWSSRGDRSEPLANEKLGGAEVPITSSPCQNQWTMAHAYYAYTGGFELDSSDPNHTILPPGRERMRLTLKGVAVALKLRPELLRDLPTDAILDKSKASPLTKAIVCGQALWFCLQCLGRVISSAPLSLLEVQWWHKPLDIATPTVLRGDSVRELLAWMSMHMPMNALGLSSDNRREAQSIRTVDRDDPYSKSISTSRLAARDGVQEACDVVLGPSDSPPKCIALADCDELLSTGLCFYDEGEATPFFPSWFVILKPMDIERWKCAATLFKENPPSGIWTEYDGLLVMNASEWPSTLGLSVWVLFVCAALIYGGLHALPWNSEFRTGHEKSLWRASVMIIVGFPLVLVAAYLARAVRREMRNPFPLLKTSKRREVRFFINVGTSVGYVALYALSSLYVLARVFIVVECVIALFNSVPGVFEVPAWSAYFPHIN